MTDADIITELTTRLAYHETQAERCRQTIAILSDDGPLVRTKRAATPQPKRSGEQRHPPSEGKRAAVRARQAEGLALLKQGKTAGEVAKHFGVSPSAVYLWQKAAR